MNYEKILADHRDAIVSRLPDGRPEQAGHAEGGVEHEDGAGPGQALEGAVAEGGGAAEEDDQVVVDVEVVEEGGDHQAAEVAAEGGERAVVGEVVHLPLEHPLGVHELAREVSLQRQEKHCLMEAVKDQDISMIWVLIKSGVSIYQINEIVYPFPFLSALPNITNTKHCM